jgi:hypothetical protein
MEETTADPSANVIDVAVSTLATPTVLMANTTNIVAIAKPKAKVKKELTMA